MARKWGAHPLHLKNITALNLCRYLFLLCLSLATVQAAVAVSQAKHNSKADLFLTAHYVAGQENGGGVTCTDPNWLYTTLLSAGEISGPCTPFRTIKGDGELLGPIRWRRVMKQEKEGYDLVITQLFNDSKCNDEPYYTDSVIADAWEDHKCNASLVEYRATQKNVARRFYSQNTSLSFENRMDDAIVYRDFYKDSGCNKTLDYRLLLRPKGGGCVRADRHYRMAVLRGIDKRNMSMYHTIYVKTEVIYVEIPEYNAPAVWFAGFDFYSDSECTIAVPFFTPMDGTVLADTEPEYCWQLDNGYHRYTILDSDGINASSSEPYASDGDGHPANTLFSQWGDWSRCGCNTFMRTRTCTSGRTCGPDSVWGEHCDDPECEEDGLGTSTIVGIILGLVGGLLVGGALAVYWLIRRIKRAKIANQRGFQNVYYKGKDNFPKEFMKVATREGLGAPGLVHPGRQPNVPIAHSTLTKVGKLGEGHYGVVYFGLMKEQGSVYAVAVKELWDCISDEAAALTLKEAALMGELDHPNVLRCVGTTSEKRRPLMIVMELMGLGSLQDYLRIRKKREQPVSVSTRLHVAYQIAQGMAYLSSKGLVHRDLAARNCLLADGDSSTFDNPIVKVSDFGMARHMLGDQYITSKRGALAVAWMAPEVIVQGQCSEFSDVWSFGVVMWEIFMDAATPFAREDKRTVGHRVASGNLRLRAPSNCPPEVQRMMWDCWQPVPNQRPRFSELVGRLAEIFAAQKPAKIQKLPTGEIELTEAKPNEVMKSEKPQVSSRVPDQVIVDIDQDEGSENSTDEDEGFENSTPRGVGSPIDSRTVDANTPPDAPQIDSLDGWRMDGYVDTNAKADTKCEGVENSTERGIPNNGRAVDANPPPGAPQLENMNYEDGYVDTNSKADSQGERRRKNDASSTGECEKNVDVGAIRLGTNHCVAL